MSNVNNNSNSTWRPLQSPDPQPSQNLRGTTRIAWTPHSQTTGAPSRAADVIGPLRGSQAGYNNNLDTLFGSASGSLSTRAAPMEQPQESRAFETWYDSIWNDPQPPAQIADQAKAENQSRDGLNLASTASATTPADRHIRRPLQPGTYKHGPLNVGPITRKYALLQDPHLKLHARVLDPYSRQGPTPQTQPSNRQPAPNDDSSQDYTSGSESGDYDSSALTWESAGEQSPAERIHEHGGAEFPAADPIGVPGSGSVPWAGDDLPEPIPLLPLPTATTPSKSALLTEQEFRSQEFRTFEADMAAFIARAHLSHAPAITDPQSNLSATPAPASIKPLKSRKVRLASGNRDIRSDDPSEIPAFQKLSDVVKQLVRDKLVVLRNGQKYQALLSAADFEATHFIYKNYDTTQKKLGLAFGLSEICIARHLRQIDREKASSE